jgi:hypothetical protein
MHIQMSDLNILKALTIFVTFVLFLVILSSQWQIPQQLLVVVAVAASRGLG